MFGDLGPVGRFLIRKQKHNPLDMMTPEEIEFSDSPLFFIIFVGFYFSIWGLLYDQEHGQTTLRQHEVWVKPSNSARLPSGKLT